MIETTPPAAAHRHSWSVTRRLASAGSRARRCLALSGIALLRQLQGFAASGDGAARIHAGLFEHITAGTNR
jgi:hypothetical protein